MRVVLAGATGAIGRPLIRHLKDAGHTVFGLARSPESARALSEAGAGAITADALNAAAVRAAIARIRPDAVINELTALPAHHTKAEMQAAAARDYQVRFQGNANLLAVIGEAGVRRYILQSAGFWYAPGAGLADESEQFAFDATPGISASARTYAELESSAQTSGLQLVALRYGFFYGPGTWYCSEGDMGDQVRRQLVPVIGKGEGVWSWVHVEDAAAATVAALSVHRAYSTSSTATPRLSTYSCPLLPAQSAQRNRRGLPSNRRSTHLAPTRFTTRRGCAVRRTRRRCASCTFSRARSNGCSQRANSRAVSADAINPKRPGGVAERLKAPVLKTGRDESPSWVRIPPPPPKSSNDSLTF